MGDYRAILAIAPLWSLSKAATTWSVSILLVGVDTRSSGKTTESSLVFTRL